MHKTIKHAVWPTKAPDVTTGLWDQKDWDRFADGYKPKDYFGDRYRQEDWLDYMQGAEERKIDAIRTRAGMPKDPRSEHFLWGKTIHGNAHNAVREAHAMNECAVVYFVEENQFSRWGWVTFPLDRIDASIALQPDLVVLENGEERAVSPAGAAILIGRNGRAHGEPSPRIWDFEDLKEEVRRSLDPSL